jgi:hypothetical protein
MLGFGSSFREGLSIECSLKDNFLLSHLCVNHENDFVSASGMLKHWMMMMIRNLHMNFSILLLEIFELM